MGFTKVSPGLRVLREAVGDDVRRGVAPAKPPTCVTLEVRRVLQGSGVG